MKSRCRAMCRRLARRTRISDQGTGRQGNTTTAAIRSTQPPSVYWTGQRRLHPREPVRSDNSSPPT